MTDDMSRSHAYVEGERPGSPWPVAAVGEAPRQAAPDMRPSTLQDAERGRRLEVDETLGHTLKLATEHGAPAPTLDLCFTVLAASSRAATPSGPYGSLLGVDGPAACGALRPRPVIAGSAASRTSDGRMARR